MSIKDRKAAAVNAAAAAAAAVVSDASAVVPNNITKPDSDVVFPQLEGIGYQVGLRLIERLTKDHARFKDELDIMKFVCTDLWKYMYEKQVCYCCCGGMIDWLIYLLSVLFYEDTLAEWSIDWLIAWITIFFCRHAIADIFFAFVFLRRSTRCGPTTKERMSLPIMCFAHWHFSLPTALTSTIPFRAVSWHSPAELSAELCVPWAFDALSRPKHCPWLCASLKLW